MSTIKVLPPDVIAQIAAGEVVDRPASVIKELLENSIDAGATSIEIHLEDAGKELIHIHDNGCGISHEDLTHIFQRHATSKIKSIDDLETLGSMGFRGEALYSIAAISDVQLKSQKDSNAWAIHMRGGQRINLEPCAQFGSGTDIKIAELFFNTPARRKFLKSNASEINQILGLVLPYALIYPDKRFLLTHAGRALLDLKPVLTPKHRTAIALNVDDHDLLEITHDAPDDHIHINATLGNINIQRPRRNLQYIFINHRPVESKAIAFAMNDIYRTILPPGVYGAFVLNVLIDPSLVDANIHPTKREVRIKDEARLCSIIRRMTQQTLMTQGSAKTIEQSFEPMSFSAPTGIPANNIIFAPDQIKNARNPDRYTLQEPTANYRSISSTDNFSLPDLFNSSLDNLHTKFTRARYIGAFINKYLLFEDGTSLFMVDQHAAQERIMFERFSKQINDATIETQPLLTPILIKITAQEHTAWNEIQEDIKSIGIEATLFDDETLAIHTQPILLKNIEHSLRTLLSGEDIARCDRNTIAMRACKASIVTGDRLSPQQADYQRHQLLACQSPFTCPHGRPTVVELKESFLNRQFLRS